MIWVALALSLLIQCKNEKNGISDGELLILLYSTYKAPDPSCVNPSGSGYTLLSNSVPVNGVGNEKYYFRRTSSSTRFTVTLQQAGCSVQRSYSACNGGYPESLTTYSNTSGITCSDGTTTVNDPISGGVGVTEACTITRNDEFYRIGVANFGTSCSNTFLAENL